MRRTLFAEAFVAIVLALVIAACESPVAGEKMVDDPAAYDRYVSRSISAEDSLLLPAESVRGVNGEITFTQVVTGSSGPDFYVPPLNGGGFNHYTPGNKDFGWRHRFDMYAEPGMNIISASLMIEAWDVDSSPTSNYVGEFDGVSVDGAQLNPGFLQGRNEQVSRTTFDVPITSILDDGIVNVWLDIDMEREGWLTTVQQSVLTVTYLYVPGNLPPFQPELLASNNGEASIDRPLEVTVSGPNPPDPNEGDTVSYSYRWYVDVGQGYYIDDEFAGKPNHTGSSIPASSLELGEKWCVQVTPMDQHHFAGPSATVYWAPVAEINYPPVAVAGNDQVVEQTSPQGAVAALSAAASSDAEGDALGYLWTWNGGSADTMEFEALFPAGVTELTLRVYEVATGIWAEDSVLVTVVDTTPPVLTVPAPQTVEQVGPAGTPLVLTASATDAADPDVEIVSDAPAVFPAGVTIVTFTATDDAGNVSVATTTVTVVDTTPPALTIPADMVVEQQGPEGSVVALHASATDAVDLDVELWSDAPAVFPAGVTTVTFHARDDAGNQSSSSMTVTVRDTTAPTIVVDQYATLLWPPNHRMERIASVSASDAVDPNAELVIRVTHNQNPHDNVGVGDGHTLFDWLVEENGDVWVRAERDGRGNDRVYTISVTATDAAGNVATRTFTVTVPHSNPY